MTEEERLPAEILQKAIISGKEYGWLQKDVLEVLEAAEKIPMATVGGTVEYVFPDGICELYWFNFSPMERQSEEKWPAYCKRTKIEVSKNLLYLISDTDFKQQAIKSFDFLKNKDENGVDIENHRYFILYFDDTESDLWVGNH